MIVPSGTIQIRISDGMSFSAAYRLQHYTTSYDYFHIVKMPDNLSINLPTFEARG